MELVVSSRNIILRNSELLMYLTLMALLNYGSERTFTRIFSEGLSARSSMEAPTTLSSFSVSELGTVDLARRPFLISESIWTTRFVRKYMMLFLAEHLRALNFCCLF